jgi:predicted ArsR family transcriptional regulator
MPKTQPELTPGSSRVLALLKRQGPISADSLAEILGLTAMAVRFHLGALHVQGLARFIDEARPRGRPVQMWTATPEAWAHFPDSHGALAADLIVQARRAFGEEGVERMLKLRTAEQEKTYRVQTESKSTLKGKLDALARLREREGYMVEVRRDEDTGGYVFIENHCPILAGARTCQGLCREELSLFQKVLGKAAKLERTSHILAGASRCAYRVTQAA